MAREARSSGYLTHQQIDLAHRQARQRARTGSTIQQKGYSIAASATRDMQSQHVVMARGPQYNLYVHLTASDKTNHLAVRALWDDCIKIACNRTISYTPSIAS